MKITGNKYALYISSDGGNTFMLVSQQTNVDVTFNTQTVAKVGRNVRFAENRTGNQGGNGSASVLLNFTSQLNYKELFAFWKNRTLLKFRIQSIEPDESNEKITEFDSYIIDVKKSSGMDAFVGVDLSFTVDGEPRLIDPIEFGEFVFAFYSEQLGDISPTVTTFDSSVFGWTINDLSAGQSNSPTLTKVDPLNIIRAFSPTNKGNLTTINLNGCNLSDAPLLGVPFLDLTGNGWTLLASFTAQQQVFTLKVGSWINKDNISIDITNATPNKEQIKALLADIVAVNGLATNTGRTLALGNLTLDGSIPDEQEMIDDIEALESANWTITSVTKAAFSFTTNSTGNIEPEVTQTVGSPTGFFVVNGVTYNSDSPTILAAAGQKVVYFNTGRNLIEEVNLNGCGITGVQSLDFSQFTDLTDLTATNQDFNLLVGDWIKQASITIDITNSLPQAATNQRPYDLIKRIVIANGGTYSDDGSNFTGTAGENHASRTLALGTVVLDSAVAQDQITLDMITALQAVGWTITTILTLCNKFLDFYLVKNTIVSGGQTVRYEIPKNYTTDRPANSPILLLVDVSEIVPGTLSLKLFDTDGTTELASNFAAINTDLEANNRTGGFLEVSGLPNSDVANVVVTISDFPTVEKVCGAFTSSDNITTFLKLQQGEGITAVSGNVETWEDVVNAANLTFTQAVSNKKPILFGNVLRFTFNESLATTAAKSEYNFLHDGTVDYAIVMAVDLSASTGNNLFNQIFSTEGFYSSVNVGLSIIYEQRNISPNKGIGIAISRGVTAAFTYVLTGINIVNGMAIYTFNVPINSAGAVELFVNKVLGGSGARLNPPTLNNSTYDLAIGRAVPAISGFGSADMDLADLVIIKNPTSAEIEAVEQILAAKNNITL